MKFTNNQNLPAPLVALLTQDFYSKGASEYSVTELMSPPRIRRLREQHNKEMVQDVTQLIASKLGTFMHGKLEAKELPGHTNEERVFKEVDGVTISGAIDLQSDDGGVVITDYKFVKSWAVVNHRKQGHSDWNLQLNIYKWLVETVNQKTVTGLNICAVIKDFNKRDAGDFYPEAEAVMIPIPMMDNTEIEQYVRGRLEAHRDSKVAHDLGEELAFCTDEERWMRETTYATKREGRKTAIRVFKTIEEANELAIKEKGYVETRPGEPIRCTGNYCGVAQWCNQYAGEKHDTE